MKRAIIAGALCLMVVFTALHAQGEESLRLHIGASGLQEKPASQALSMSVSGKVVATYGNYFLTQDIAGNDYEIDLRCKTEPTGQSGTIKAVIKIGGEIVADTAFQVTGIDWKLYHFSMKGTDPTIAGSAEVELILTVETIGEVMTYVAFGPFGEPQSSIVIPAPSGTVGVKEGTLAATPRQIELLQNYPNPFNPSTRITYELPQSEFVIMKVYDILGKEVTTLVNEYRTQGTHHVNFDANNLSGGVYLYRLQAGKHVQTKKMILSR